MEKIYVMRHAQERDLSSKDEKRRKEALNEVRTVATNLNKDLEGLTKIGVVHSKTYRATITADALKDCLEEEGKQVTLTVDWRAGEHMLDKIVKEHAKTDNDVAIIISHEPDIAEYLGRNASYLDFFEVNPYMWR